MAIKKRDEAINDFNRKVNRLEREYREVKGENSKIKGYLGVLSVGVIVLAILSVIVINLTGFSIFNEGGTSLELVHYAMNDNAGNTNVVDSSGNGYTGTATTATSSLTTHGKINNALTLNGNSIDVGRSFSELSNGNFSVSVWFNTAQNDYVDGVFSNGGSGTYHTMYFTSYHVSFNSLYFAWFDDTNTEQFFNPSIIPTVNIWHNVIIVKDGVNMSMYYDGAWISSTITTTTLATPTNNMKIGTDGYGNNMNGKVDDFRLYNVALTQEQINALYNLTTVSGTAEVAHWTLNDNDVDAYVDDSSGNGYTGTAQQSTNTITTSGKINSAMTFSGAVSAGCSGDHSACSSHSGSGDAVCTSHGCSWVGLGDCSMSWNADQGGCEGHTSGPWSCSAQYGADPYSCGCSDPNNCACYSGCYTNPNNCACGDPNNCACSDSNSCACYPDGMGDPYNCGDGMNSCETNTCTCYPSGNPNNCACGDPNNCACGDPANCACYGGACSNPNNCACGSGPFSGCSGTWGDNCYDSPHACSTLDQSTCESDSGNGCAWTSAVSAKYIDGGSIDFSGLDQFSVSAWVYPTDLSGTYLPIFVQRISCGALNMQVYAKDGGDCSGNYPMAYLTTSTGNTLLCSTQTINQDAWQLITTTYNGTTLTIYRNGVYDTSTGATGTFQQSSVNSYVGWDSCGNNIFAGTIDDVRLYNYALSSSQVAVLYANSSEDSLSVGLIAPLGTEANLAATVVADTNAPSAEIASPQQNANYNTRVIDLNYSASDDVAVDKCWYSFDAGITMSAAQTCGANWTGLTALNDGENRWTVYVNDTAGNTNSTDVFFYVDTIYPTITITSPENITYNLSSSITVNFTSSDETAVSSKWFYNGTGNTTYTDVVTQVLADGQYTFMFYTNDSSGNVNSSSVTFAVSTANTGLPSCLSQCTQGSGCVITSDCHLDSSMCSGNLCQFTNLTLSAKLKTGTDSSGTAKDLAINITSTANSPVLFLAGGAINFTGKSGSVGGNASIVNITVYNLFNTTNAFFYGIGGASSTSAKGGNGGKLQINAHGVIRWFSDYDVSGGESADNAPVLTRGSSNGGTDGTAGTKTFVKDLSCSSLRFRDIDVDKDGLVNSADVADTVARYNYRDGQALYTEGSDINCDSNINVIELSREGLQYNTR